MAVLSGTRERRLTDRIILFILSRTRLKFGFVFFFCDNMLRKSRMYTSSCPLTPTSIKNSNPASLIEQSGPKSPYFTTYGTYDQMKSRCLMFLSRRLTSNENSLFGRHFRDVFLRYVVLATEELP